MYFLFISLSLFDSIRTLFPIRKTLFGAPQCNFQQTKHTRIQFLRSICAEVLITHLIYFLAVTILERITENMVFCWLINGNRVRMLN